MGGDKLQVNIRQQHMILNLYPLNHGFNLSFRLCFLLKGEGKLYLTAMDGVLRVTVADLCCSAGRGAGQGRWISPGSALLHASQREAANCV